MIHQSVNDLQTDSEIAFTRLAFSPTADLIKHSREVSEHIISNKLINEASDSDYSRINEIVSKAPLCVNDLICRHSESEFLIDENTRLSFGAMNEINDSTIDMDTSTLSFSRENFGKYIIDFLPNISFQLLS